MDKQKYRQCHGCKAVFEYKDDISLIGHGIGRYGVNSPECHEAMLELYGREFIDEEGKVYRVAQQSIIDAYTALHPQCIEHQLKAGIEKRLIEASIKSVNLHLIAVYCFLERKMQMPEIRSAMARILKNGPATFPELKPLLI